MKIPNSNIQNASIKIIKSSGKSASSEPSADKTLNSSEGKISSANRVESKQAPFTIKDVQKLSSQDIQRLRLILSDEQLSKSLQLSQKELASLKTRADFEKLTVYLAKVDNRNIDGGAKLNTDAKKNNEPIIFITRENITKGQHIFLNDRAIEAGVNKTLASNELVLSVTQQKTLTEALRHYLPNQRTLDSNLKDLTNLNNAINSLGATVKNKLIGENVLKSLELVLKGVLETKPHIKPELLIQRIKHSGIFLESHLKSNTSSMQSTMPTNTATSNTTPMSRPIQTSAQQSPTTSENLNLGKTLSNKNIVTPSKNAEISQTQTQNTMPLQKTGAQALIPRVATVSKPLQAITAENPTSINKNEIPATRPHNFLLSNSIDTPVKNGVSTAAISEQDLKSALIQLLLSLGVNPAIPINSNISKTSRAIDALIQAFLLPSKTQEQQKQVQTNIRDAIKNLSLSALSRIVTLQLQNRLQQSADRISTGNQTIEIPMKIGEHWTPLTLHIEQKDCLDEAKDHSRTKHEDEEKEAKSKKKQWNVFLELNFSDSSAFSCEINVIENTVTSSLWAEDLELRKSLVKRLPELEQELKSLGIEVEQLRCINNKPARQANTIQQSIVDIKT